MAEDWYIDRSAGKTAAYAELLRGIRGLTDGEPNRMANLSNVTAALQATFQWHWVGFYLVDARRDELVLGPFQGPVACTRLRRGKGVCAAAWESGRTVNVPDVEAFPGHVACSSLSQSEIVVPIVVEGIVVAVCDVDAATPGAFDAEDEAGLGALMAHLATEWSQWE